MSNIGDGVALAAAPLLIASQTRDPFLISLAALAQRTPWLFIGLYAGVLADQVDRRRLIVIGNGVRAIVLTGLTATIVGDRVDVTIVLAALFVLATAEVFVDISTGTLLPMIVSSDDLTITIFTFNLAFGALIALLVLLSIERLGLGELGFGLLTSASAGGAVIGSVLYVRAERAIGMVWIMRIGLVIETLTYLVFALTTVGWIAMAMFFLFGIHSAMWGTTSTTVRQRAVPAALQGRISSVYLVAVQGGIAIGAALGGVISSIWGVARAYWFAFAISAAALAAIWRELRHIEEDPAGSSAVE